MPVYFITSSDQSSVKIGKSTNVSARVKQLQTGNPNQLFLMGWIESENDGQLERFLHQKYAQHRGNGEWFFITSTEVLRELSHYLGYAPRKENAFEVVGFDRDGIPEYLGAWDWGDLELHECCPFCGSFSGMHFQEASQMYYCRKCQKLTDFEELSPPNSEALYLPADSKNE